MITKEQAIVAFNTAMDAAWDKVGAMSGTQLHHDGWRIGKWGCASLDHMASAFKEKIELLEEESSCGRIGKGSEAGRKSIGRKD